jgi:FemAB-related protein (PEP-CTERM system-associated)
MPPEVCVEETPASDSAWDPYVTAHRYGTGYHLLAWRRIVENVFGHRTFYLAAKDRDGQIRGVLPLVFLSSRLFGKFLVSLPFLNYGGVLASESDSERALLERAEQIARQLGAGHIELRHGPEIGLQWIDRQHKVSMRLELPADFAALWKSFPAKLRSQIRRADKEGMTCRIGGAELLDDFYAVFSRNMRDLGTPIYGRDFFAEILKTFPGAARIGAVYLGARAVAGGFLYGFKDLLEIPWASSDRRYNRLAPNMLLYKSVLEHACEQKFRIFDFGRSTPGSGTYRFKEQWGARPVGLHWYYWLADGGAPPDLSPSNSKFRLAISVWRRLPLALSRRLGPNIVRYIP